MSNPMNNLIAPSFQEINQMYIWTIINNDDIKWYVDMEVIDKEDYALITGEKYPEES